MAKVGLRPMDRFDDCQPAFITEMFLGDRTRVGAKFAVVMPLKKLLEWDI